LDEQQLPNVELRQVALVSELEPQLPSVLVLDLLIFDGCAV
jgi:hypothetical protein